MRSLIAAMEAAVPCLLDRRKEASRELADDIAKVKRDFGNSPTSEAVQDRVVRLAAAVAEHLTEERVAGGTAPARLLRAALDTHRGVAARE